MLPPLEPVPPGEELVVLPVPVLFADGSVAFDAVRVAKRYPGDGTVWLTTALWMTDSLLFRSVGLNQ